MNSVVQTGHALNFQTLPVQLSCKRSYSSVVFCALCRPRMYYEAKTQQVFTFTFPQDSERLMQLELIILAMGFKDLSSVSLI